MTTYPPARHLLRDLQLTFDHSSASTSRAWMPVVPEICGADGAVRCGPVQDGQFRPLEAETGRELIALGLSQPRRGRQAIKSRDQRAPEGGLCKARQNAIP